jgi:hypothetical protein
MAPRVSKAVEITKMPSMGVEPTVGFIAYRAARDAGVPREPSASVPIDMGLYPAETPTAEPVEEPPGACDDRVSGVYLSTCTEWSQALPHCVA